MVIAAFEPVNDIGINVTDSDPSARRHVLPEYYGLLAVADAIGTSGNTVGPAGDRGASPFEH